MNEYICNYFMKGVMYLCRWKHLFSHILFLYVFTLCPPKNSRLMNLCLNKQKEIGYVSSIKSTERALAEKMFIGLALRSLGMVGNGFFSNISELKG